METQRGKQKSGVGCGVWRWQQEHIFRGVSVTKSGFLPLKKQHRTSPSPTPSSSHNNIRKPVSHGPPESPIPTPEFSWWQVLSWKAPGSNPPVTTLGVGFAQDYSKRGPEYWLLEIPSVS